MGAHTCPHIIKNIGDFMFIPAVKQMIVEQTSKIGEKWNHPTVFKVKAISFEIFNLMASFASGFVGSLFGVVGGVVLVGIGTVLGLGSLIVHVSTLFATCIVDSYNAAFEHSYNYIARARPQPKPVVVVL